MGYLGGVNRNKTERMVEENDIEGIGVEVKLL